MGYLRINVLKLSYAEGWNWFGWRGFLIFVVLKILHIPLRNTNRFPDSPGITKLTLADIRPDLAAGLQPKLNAVLACGFELVFYYKVDSQGPAAAVSAATIDPSGLVICVITFAKVRGMCEAAVGAISMLDDGRIIVTNDSRRSIDPPPEIDVLRMYGQMPAQVISVHQERVFRLRPRAFRPDEVECLIMAFQKALLDHNIKRGLYVPVQ